MKTIDVDNMVLVFVSKNKDGNFYFGFRFSVSRGIRGKNKGKVDELLIIGMNKEKAINFMKKNGIKIKEEKFR